MGKVRSLDDPRTLVILLHDILGHILGPLTKISETGSILERIARSFEHRAEARREGTVITDKRGRLLSVIAPLPTIFGFDSASILGKRGCAFLDPATIPVVRYMIKMALRPTGPTAPSIVRCRDHAGNWHLIKLEVKVITTGRDDKLLMFSWKEIVSLAIER